ARGRARRVWGSRTQRRAAWACVTVVLASGGYPGPYQSGLPVTGLEAGAATRAAVHRARPAPAPAGPGGAGRGRGARALAARAARAPTRRPHWYASTGRTPGATSPRPPTEPSRSVVSLRR